VFAELNRGSDVTKNLRKVDKSEMTHKNPALRASPTVPSTIVSPPAGAHHTFHSLDVVANTHGLVVSAKEAS
jgi:hypothetical protein